MFFRVLIRSAFIFAYLAFLGASIQHVAYFFHSFEPAGEMWAGSYAIAISIDVLALILIIGVMFFRKDMSVWAKVGVWLFILGLTAFSWFINWEYASQFQSSDLSHVQQFYWLNPILASAFAFLNLAYAIVSELFNAKTETAEELRQKNDEMAALNAEKTRRSDMQKQQILHSISNMKSVAQSAFSSPQNESELQPISSQNSDTIPPALPSDESVQETESLDENPDENMEDLPSKPSTKGPYFVSFEEASRMTGYAVATLWRQVAKGEIEANKTKDKVKVSSLKYKPGFTAKLPILSLVSSRENEREIS